MTTAPLPQRRRLGRLSLTLMALGIVGAGILIGELTRRPTVPAARFNIAAVTRGDLRPAVRGWSRLEPAQVSHVRAAAAGRVERVLVRPGERVEVGTTLATLERGPLLTEMRRADAHLARAEAAAAETRLRMARVLDDLNDQGAPIPDSEDRLTSDQVNAAIAYARNAAAAAEVAARQATLSLAARQVRAATVKATTAGTVSAVAIEPGSVVAPGDPLFTVAADGQKLRAVVRVGDHEVGRIRVGQRATLLASGFPGHPFGAVVVDAPLLSPSNATLAGFPVGLLVDNAAGELMAGMSIEAAIDVAPVMHVLRVPAAALTFVPAGAAERDASQPTVWTLRGGEPARVAVTVGAQEDNLVEVRGDGLFEGAPVIVSERGGRP